MEKKVLSINLASYLITRGFNYKSTGVLVEDGKEKCYLVFDQTAEVAKAISEYKNDKFLKEYGSNFKKLKTLFNQIR
ncbi:MAG: DUF5659 domain-containing protein [Bacillota bacterium]